MGGLGLPELLIVLIIFLPFIINYSLAKSRDKNVILILLLTVIFSWIVTLILAVMPKAEAVNTDDNQAIQQSPQKKGGALIVTKTCPMCAETIKLEAKICKHCGKRFSEDEIAKEKNKFEGMKTTKCEFCKKFFPMMDIEKYKGKTICPECLKIKN